jgi:PAS domain S-box-containing protein
MVQHATQADLKALLDRAVQHVRSLGWQTVALALADAPAPAPAATIPLTPALSAQLDQWTAGGFAVFIEHPAPDDLADLRAPGAGAWQPDNLLVVPLRNGLDRLGWLLASKPADRGRVTPDALQTLDVLATGLVVAIRGAREEHRLRHQLDRQAIANRIALKIAQHLELDNVFAVAIHHLQQIISFEQASIILQERPQPTVQYLKDNAPDGAFATRQITPLETLAFDWIIQQRQPALLIGTLDEGAEHPAARQLYADSARSVLCLPLTMWNQTIGAFNLAARTPGVFRPEDAEFFDQIADHLAGALWNALLYEIEQRRRHTAGALAQLSKIINSTLDLDRVLKLALEQLGRVIKYDSAAILLAEGPHLRFTAASGFEHPETLIGQLFCAEENNISHQVMQSQQVRIETDVQQVPEWGHHRGDLEGVHTIRAWIGVPLVVRGQSIGILTIDKYYPGFFDENDGETAAAFGAHIASAIFNARVYNAEHQRRETAAALVRLSQIVNSTLQLDDVLQRALEQLAQVVSYDTASIMLVEGANLVIAACRGFSDPAALLGTVITPNEVSTAYLVLTEQRARVIADVQQAPEWGHMRENLKEVRAIRSWIGAPLIVRDQGIGVLTIDKQTPDFYTEDDSETASVFAAQLATAIQNAWFFQAAERQRDRLAAIISDATDAIIVLDEQGLVWLPNRATERYLHIRPEQVLGQPVSMLGLPELDAAWRQARESMESLVTEIAGPGDRVFHASIAPMREGGWVIVMQDITPLKELDRLRTDWVTSVTHDLKNPIQVIQLGAAMLDLDTPLSGEQRERVNLIQRSVSQLSDLVTGVLDLARLEAGPAPRLVPVDPAAFVLAALGDVEDLARKKNQSLDIDVPDDLPWVQGDSILLQRALANLLGNAIKYTPPGGRVAVSAGVRGGMLEIEVSDNGPGIPPEARARLFDRFYRAPNAIGEGTGLGLSIVRSILEKHGGRIDVTSTPGEGSSFVIMLPLAE